MSPRRDSVGSTPPPEANTISAFTRHSRRSGCTPRVGRPGPLSRSALDMTTPFIGQFGSWHSGVVMFVFGDGSVRGVKTSTSGSVLRLCLRGDGQVIPE